MYLATTEQSKKIEQAITERTGGSTFDLMTAIGSGIADHISGLFSKDDKIAIVCGAGNNGGDGLIAAGKLVAQGYEVSIFSTVDPSGWSGDALLAYQALGEMPGAAIIDISDRNNIRSFETVLGESDLVLDCIFGSGLSREVQGINKYAIDGINNLAGKVFAVDIPSGFHADTGAMLGAGIRAERTLAAGVVKQGISQYPCAGSAGETVVIDMGATVLELEKYTMARTIDEQNAAAWLPERSPDSHKNNFGTIGVVAGSTGMGGAAYLSSNACIRAGAGLVYLYTPRSVAQALQAKVAEVILVPLSESNAGSISSASIGLLASNEKVDVLVVGPGLSARDETKIAVRKLVQETTADLVIDASGLDAFINQEAVIRAKTQKIVITPHPGELSRLLKLPVEEIQGDRIRYCLEIAEKMNCVAVLKGARSVIAAPNGKTYVCVKGNSGMATAGAGDVLAGIIGALLGQKMDAFHAAALGVELHSMAGDLSADDLTEYSVIASDLIDYLPVAFKYYEELRR